MFLIGFLTIAAIDFSSCNGNHYAVMCREGEKRVLLKFKKDVDDPSNRLSSWGEVVGDDCCRWEGVVCDNFTGHVIELSLGYSDKWRGLSGNINPCLQTLKHLRYLDLSGNDFTGLPFPSFIASMTQLRYIDLSNTGFVGTIPHELGNLSSLRSLSLKTHYYGLMNIKNLEWLARLSYLEHLDLSGVIIAKELNWLQVINNLPFLVELHLLRCELDHFPPLLSAINFTSLAVLDLSGNYFSSLIPGWIFSLGSLVSLHLSDCNFMGQMPEGSWNLTSLQTLDVSHNYKLDSTLPNSLFSTTNSLVRLSLAHSGFHGPLPTLVPNMTNLSHLDLSSNNLDSTIPSWLYSFSHLEFLDLAYNRLEGGISNEIGNLTSAIFLNLSQNNLEGSLPNSIGNLVSLHSLDLSYNGLEESLPRSLGNLCNLISIDLSHNKFSGELFTLSSKCTAIHALEHMRLDDNQLSGHIPDQIGQFENLSSLLLSGNLLYGPIPETLGRLTSLYELSLEENQLNGTLPQSLGHLSKLQQLDVSNNLLHGTVSDVHFTNLANLKEFHASGNRLTLKVSPDWIPPFQLLEIELGSWHLGPKFPIWLQSQKNLETIDLSYTGISDEIPTWFWNSSFSVGRLNLSHNHIHGQISYIPSNIKRAFLSSNNLNGTLPRVSSDLIELDLSKNSFSGEISHLLCDRKNEAKYLAVLLLKENFLSGEIPNCWMAWQSMTVIDMGNNNLTGNIPSSMGHLGSLQSLHLRNNHLSGEISSSLQNCTKLVVVDLSENEFIGSIPTWMGERLLHLMVLILRSNKLDGVIPQAFCRISSLTILDLANNNLSGAMPWCINNITAMTMKRNFSGDATYQVSCRINNNKAICDYIDFLENAYLVTKGSNNRYDKILTLVTSIDFSNNNISGNIPEDLTSLLGLLSLNLSGNHLIGEIPKKIGDMGSLESLDLSRNQLGGEIPPSMSGLTFLSYLNLSYNNLSGKIPLSTQLQSFNASSFIGNRLCGLPLTKKCSVDDVRNVVHNEGVGSEVDWFYLSMAFGFAAGKISLSTQLQSFNASSFLANKLCGLPLTKNCNVDGETPNVGKERDNEGAGSEVDWFYLSMAFGFAVGFWGISIPILFIKLWRYACF
ncbi:hypothetical protein TEA_024280 [Camellia sinensis var. sinensis]|uniref:Leucine-rich repeat-containing N-terminal plant-type domain-containing protein n=1 Tax=Camellia sinensis var. sinensis TaxID=542762 RepID=A0A4S4DZD4_CAMSN|nr:hypothetical protein TEA_024280 [Camellia sinensis var. sinensis]